MSDEPDELAQLRAAFPGYRFRRKEIRGAPCYLAETAAVTPVSAVTPASAATGAKVAAGASAAADAAPLAAARSPAILAAMLAAAAGRPLRLRPEAVADAYREQLMTVSQCAQVFGVSRATIVTVLSGQGIAMRRPGDGVNEEAVVAAYRDQRLSLHECAARFGISQRRVAAILDRHGVSRRPAGRPAQPHG